MCFFLYMYSTGWWGNVFELHRQVGMSLLETDRTRPCADVSVPCVPHAYHSWYHRRRRGGTLPDLAAPDGCVRSSLLQLEVSWWRPPPSGRRSRPAHDAAAHTEGTDPLNSLAAAAYC